MTIAITTSWKRIGSEELWEEVDGTRAELREALSALEAIAGMQVDENTDHAQLLALCIAIARTVVGTPVPTDAAA